MDSFVIDRLQQAMDVQGVDGVIAFSPENVAYGAGYLVPSQTLHVRNRQFAVAVNRDGDSRMLLTSNEVAEAQTRSRIEELRSYDEFRDDPVAVLAGALNELGLTSARIGAELTAMPIAPWGRLGSSLPRATWLDGTSAFAHARMVKSPRELDCLRRACHAAEAAQAEAHRAIHAGMTENELYRLLADAALAHGADKILMIQVATAERSIFSNPTPTDRRFKTGDQIKIDMFVTVDGYLSDTGRTVVVGESSELQREVWSRMQETLARVLDSVRPGISTSKLWSIFSDTFASYDMVPKIRFLGHGLGLSLHEEPFIAAHVDTTLEEGMVFAIEPVYKLDDVAFHLEDNVIVTNDGLENMTTRFGTLLPVAG
jgi:Xaa-Pro aminopeptidase